MPATALPRTLAATASAATKVSPVTSLVLVDVEEPDIPPLYARSMSAVR
jgi:hypothetical protein